MHRFLTTRPGRALALGLCGLTGPLACLPSPLLEPESGLRDYESPGLVPVPGGFVNAAGGNLLLLREDLSLDTPLGPLSITATYDSSTGAWRWSHQTTYDGATLVDPSGAVFDLSEIADGAPVEGTVWQRVDADTIETRGGLAYHFAPDGALDHVRWATLAYPRIIYTADEISQCLAPVACTPIFALASDGSGRLVSITDARSGRVARFEYDALGRLVVAQGPGDVALGRPGWRYGYEVAGTLLVGSESSEGERVEYAYAPWRRVASVTRIGEGDPRHRFVYQGKTPGGRFPTIHTNPLGGRTRYAFDAQRRLLRVRRLDTGETTDREWVGLRPSRQVDPAGATWEFRFEDDRLVAWTDPSGNSVTRSFEPGGLNPADPSRPAPLRRDDSLGLVEVWTYDAEGRPIARTNGAGETVSWSWSGASVASTTRLGVTLDFPLFGVHGHWLEARIDAVTVAMRAFDPVGNEVVRHEVLREGGVLAEIHGPDRRVAALEVADSDDAGAVTASATATVSRRSDGRITRIARLGGADHELDYDALGRAVRIRERVDGEWRVTSITYDAADQQLSRERENGMREEFEYDVFGRMTRQRALRHGVLEGEALFTWSEGRLVVRYDSVRDLTEVYAYDAAGRLASTLFGHGETISREYDVRGRLVAEVFSAPVVGVVADLGYAWDAADRPTRLVDRAAGEVLVEDVIEDGLRISSATANGLVRSHAFDAKARLVGMETRDAAGTIVESTAISRATLLDPPRVEIASATTTALASTQERYWLPAGAGLSQPDSLVGKRLFGWRDENGAERSFAWDGLSNAAETAAGDAFGYNAERNRLLSVSLASGGGSIDYAYDEAGFVVLRDGVPLGWTATGRLASFGPDALLWDLSGRLVEATIDGVTREFRLFGGRVESSLTSLGALDLGVVSIHLGSGERRYRHADFRGNVGFVTDDAGAVVAQHRYAPYGVEESFGGEPGGIAFERSAGVGPLVLLGERVLDPVAGRFLSPDPQLQLLNQYAYTLGNPIGFDDRGGRHMAPRRALELGMAIATIAVAAFIVVAVLTGAPAFYIAAAGAAYAVTNGVVTAVLLIDEFSQGEAVPGSGALSAPDPPPPPDPPGPGGGGEGAPAPQLKMLVLEAAATPACTPLAAVGTRASGATPWLLLLLNLLLGVAWWRVRRVRGS